MLRLKLAEIDRDELIVEFSSCKNLWEDELGDFRCGPGKEYASRCILDDYDGFDGCPVMKDEDEIYNSKKTTFDRYSILLGIKKGDIRNWTKENIEGYTFLRRRNRVKSKSVPDPQLQLQI